MNFKEKYLEYKIKYKNLRNYLTGGNINLEEIILNKNQKIHFKPAKVKIEKINFSFGNVPKIKGKNFMHKLKIINNKYKKELDYNIIKSVCDKCQLPKNMCILDKIYNDNELNKLFNLLENAYQLNKNDKSFTYQKEKERVFMFDLLSVRETINKAYDMNMELGLFLSDYIANIYNILNMNKKDIGSLLDKSKLVIARYSNLTGLHTHIDKVGRADGPVLTMSVGPTLSIYDLIPIKASENNSLRAYIKEGQIIIMDGESRFLWFHGLPFNYKYNGSGIRYSLILLTNKFRIKDKFWSDFWEQEIDITIDNC